MIVQNPCPRDAPAAPQASQRYLGARCGAVTMSFVAGTDFGWMQNNVERCI